MRMYIAMHVKGDIDDPEDIPFECLKILGVFSSEENASSYIEYLRDKPGFLDFQKGFGIHSSVLDSGGWSEGFISVDEAMTDYTDEGNDDVGSK